MVKPESRMPGARLALPALVMTAALGAAALPASADWLVLRDGSRVETKGPWQEKGRLVVFTRSDGTLASLRAAELDLEASRKATAESLQGKVEPAGDPAAAAPKKKLAVITDQDLPHRAPPAAPAAASPDAPPPPAGPVSVTNWRKQVMPGDEGLLILGTLQNVTPYPTSNLTLQISLLDTKGALLATAPGLFPTRILPPRGSVEFRATFPGVMEFAGLKFDAGGWAPEPPKPEAGSEPPAGAASPPPADPNAPPPPPIQR